MSRSPISEGDLVIRASPRTLLTYALAPAVTAIVVFILVAAVSHRNAGLAFGAAFAYWLVHIPFVLRLRARFTAAGIDARNAFRSFSASWDEIEAIRVIPGLWYSYDTSWTRMLEVEITSGHRFPLRCCTKLRKPTTDELEHLLDQRASQYGFTVPETLRLTRKVDWSDVSRR